jgi:hypothetical protein
VTCFVDGRRPGHQDEGPNADSARVPDKRFPARSRAEDLALCRCLALPGPPRCLEHGPPSQNSRQVRPIFGTGMDVALHVDPIGN